MCWPQPSSARPACRPRRPRPGPGATQAPPTNPPAGPRLRPATPRPRTQQRQTRSPRGASTASALASVDHRRRRLRRWRLLQRRLPDGRHVPRHGAGRVLPGRRQSLVNGFAAHFGGRAGQRPGHGRHQPVRRAATSPRSNGARREPPGEAQRPDRRPRRQLQPSADPGSQRDPPPTAGVLDLAYSGATGVLYAGGDFGKIGTGAAPTSRPRSTTRPASTPGPAPDRPGSPVARTRRSSRSPSAPTAPPSSSAATSTTVHGEQTVASWPGSTRHCSRGTGASPNYGDLGARVRSTWPWPPDNQTCSPPSDARPRRRRATATGSSPSPGTDPGPGTTTTSRATVQAVELIGTTVYFGILRRLRRRQRPAGLASDQYRRCGIDFSVAENGHVRRRRRCLIRHDWSTSTAGVFDLTQGAGRLVAVGDFTSVGTTGNLHGLAIFA